MAYQRYGQPRISAPTPTAHTEHKPAASKTINTQTVLRAVLFTLIASLLGIGVYLMSSEGKTVPFKFERDATELKAAPTVQSVFTEQRVVELRGGTGLEVEFVVRFRGENVFQQTVKLSRWSRLDEWLTSRPARTDEVEQLKKQFTEVAAAWANPPAISPVCDVVVDTSGGIDQDFRALIIERMNRVGCTDLVNAGLGMEFTGFRFGATDYLDYQSIVIAPSSRNLAGVNNAISNVARYEAAKESTSLAAALFNVLGRNQGKKFRTVAVFSDGIQNGRGADFYKDAPTDERQYHAIFQALEKEGGVQCPDLTGVWLYWYCPRDAAHAAQIRAARDFWKSVLTKKGAVVKEMEY